LTIVGTRPHGRGLRGRATFCRRRWRLSLPGSAGQSSGTLTIIDYGVHGCGLRDRRLHSCGLHGCGLRGCGLHGCGLHGCDVRGRGLRPWAVAHPIALPIVNRGSRSRSASRIAALTIVGRSF